MRKRIGILVLAGVLTFNQAGLVAFAQEPAGQETGVTRQTRSSLGEVVVNNNIARIDIPNEGESGYVSLENLVLKVGENEFKGYTHFESGGKSMNPIDLRVMFQEENNTSEDIIYNATATVRDDYGETMTYTFTIRQKGTGIVETAQITGVEERSKTVVDKKTTVVYDVTGADLKAVGVKIKPSLNEELDSSLYSVVRSGEGAKQTVTITFDPVNRFGDPLEGNFDVLFYPTESTSGTAAVTKTVSVDPDAVPVVAPTLTKVEASATNLESTGGEVTFTLTGTNLTEKTGVTVRDINGSIKVTPVITGSGTKQTIKITFPENEDAEFEKNYTVKFFANGDTTDSLTENNMVSATVKVAKAEAETASITDLTTTVAGNKVTFALKGKNMKVPVAYKVMVPFTDGDKTIWTSTTEGFTGTIAGTDTEQTAVFTFDEKADDADYKVIFFADGNVSNTDAENKKESSTFTIKAKAVVDKGALEEAIKEAANYVSETDGSLTVVGYTPETAEKLMIAYRFAKGIYEDETAIQDRVNEATDALTKAIAELVVDKSNLAGWIAGSWTEEDKKYFTEESWEAYQEVIAAAKAVYENESATVDEVKNACDNIISASENLLVYVKAEEADKEALKELIDKAEALNEKEFTVDSWEELVRQLGAAKGAYDDPVTSKYMVDVAIRALTQAMEDLEGVSAKPTDPTKPADPSNPTKPGSQTKPADANKDNKADEKKAPKTADPASIAILALQGTLAAGVGATVLKRRKEDEE